MESFLVYLRCQSGGFCRPFGMWSTSCDRTACFLRRPGFAKANAFGLRSACPSGHGATIGSLQRNSYPPCASSSLLSSDEADSVDPPFCPLLFQEKEAFASYLCILATAQSGRVDLSISKINRLEFSDIMQVCRGYGSAEAESSSSECASCVMRHA